MREKREAPDKPMWYTRIGGYGHRVSVVFVLIIILAFMIFKEKIEEIRI